MHMGRGPSRLSAGGAAPHVRGERVEKGAKHVFFAFTTSEIYAMIKAIGAQGGGLGKGRLPPHSRPFL